MLQWRNGVYELFEYIPGQTYPQTLESTFDSGRILALYHKLLEEFKSEWQPPTGSYHAASAVDSGLRSIAAGVPDTEENKEVQQLLSFLLVRIARAQSAFNRWGSTIGPSRSCMRTGIRGICCFGITGSLR